MMRKTTSRIPYLLITLVSVFSLTGCEEPPAPSYLGYAEGEYVLVASPYAGSLQQLSVTRGEAVTIGDALFALEQGNEIAARREAADRLRSAQARLANLRAGYRPEQLAELQAQAREVAAARALSASQLERDRQLFRQKFISKARLDEAESSTLR